MEAGVTVQIRMPEMGESVSEGTILEWLKQVGDPVELEEGIVEVSTDKVDTEVPSPASGVLTKILVQPDETVPVGTVLGEISQNGGGGGPAASTNGGGNGGAPAYPAQEEAGLGDESAIEIAEHGTDAEEQYEAAKEEADRVAPQPSAPSDAPAPSDAQVVDVPIPEMGESVSEGTILDWLVKVGDTVEKDQGLVEVSTDKVDAELPAPVAGTVVEILAEPDQVVSTGTVVARIAPGQVAGRGSQVAGPAEASAQAAEVG